MMAGSLHHRKQAELLTHGGNSKLRPCDSLMGTFDNHGQGKFFPIYRLPAVENIALRFRHGAGNFAQHAALVGTQNRDY